MNSKIKQQFEEYCLNLGILPVKQDKVLLTRNFEPKQFNNLPKKITKPSILENINMISTESPISYFNDGQKLIIKAMQQNKYKIIATLDLHNCTQNEALTKLIQFINNNPTYRDTCLKIIHGKGLNSANKQSVLKNLVRHFLKSHPQLLAYTAGSISQGGDGVTLVKVKFTLITQSNIK